MNLRVPKLRQGSYFPGFLEARKTSEQALVAVIQEAWIGSVSTRRVDDLVQAMGLSVDRDLAATGFTARLIHAMAREFGLLAELVIAALEEAMMAGAERLEVAHFVRMIRKRAGCIDGLNPFIADDFERIDTRKLLDRGADDVR